MINDKYVEVMVKRKPSAAMKFLKILLIMLTAAFAVVGLIGVWVALVVAVVTGVLAYVITLNAELEYEYLYIDKELCIDKIMAKSRRKRIETFEMERMEILAPFKSYRLDNYKNRQFKVVDYSKHEEEQPDIRYIMIYNGEKKVIFEPSIEMVKAIQTIAPRKVFTD